MAWRGGWALGLVLATSFGAAAAPAPITVYAAASLTESIGALAARYEAEHHVAVRVSFASSAVLARQIEAGARADVFVSADEAWMDRLADHGRLVAGSRRALVGNRLVLIAPADSATALRLQPGAPLVAALGTGRLALADPDSVPAGRYARAALATLGLWTALEPHLVRAEDVRAALLWVARGEAPLGIVYATDAAAEPRVRVLDTFPADSHPRIVYPLAIVAGAVPGAAEFTAFLASPAAHAEFARRGFTLP